MNKEDLKKLAEIINNYSSYNKEKRNDSEKKLNELRKNNMGVLCLNLLDLSTMNNYSDNNIISCLVLLRNIIEIDSKKYWGNIDLNLKEKIKQRALNLLLNNSNNYNLHLINKIIFIIEQLVHIIEDFNETWPELINLTNNLLKLSFPHDINKINPIIKTIKYCLSFLSNEIMLHLHQYNSFFKIIFDADYKNNINILTSKVICCEFYSELISYNLNNLNDISPSINFISSNMIKTLKDCFDFINNLNLNEDKIQIIIEDLTFDLLSYIEILILPDIFFHFPFLYKDLNLILNSFINLPSAKFRKIIEKSFQRLLDIYILNYNSFDDKENIVIKEYLNNLFKYAYNNLDISKDDFSSILNDYDDYEVIPKINNDFLRFVLDITSQMIEEDEKYINILLELESILLNSNDSKYNYIGLLILPQIIESRKDFNVIELYLNICLNNINNQQYYIRYACFYSINFFITNFWNNFNEKYSLSFLKLIIKEIKVEVNIHIKCEMISVFNCLISQFDEENELDYIDNENNNNFNFEEKKANNDSKQFIVNNFKEILTFLLKEIKNCLNNDCCKCLIKNELFKSLILCYQLFNINNSQIYQDIVVFLLDYLESIYKNGIHFNLYINILKTISCFGKHNENILIVKLDLLFNIIKHIFLNISKYINQISTMNSVIENILPIINSNKPELCSGLLNDLLNEIYTLFNEIEVDDLSHSDEVFNILVIINKGFEIIGPNCINFLTQAENCIEKILIKLKNISKINSIISEFLCNVIIILSNNSKVNKNIKNRGKNYLDIIFNMIKFEYDTGTSIILVDNLNKIFEIIVSNLTQNELEQIFDGIIKLIEFFENKIEIFISKKKSIDNEVKMEEEISMNLDIDNNDDDEEEDNKEIINKLDMDIENLEQVNENLSLIIENMMKYSSGKKLKNISEVIYNKVIPLLINSNNNSGNNIKIAVNLIDDIFEYLNFNKFTFHIIDDLINKLIEYSNFWKPEVRQAANYGLGIFIKLSEPSIYQANSFKILQALKASYINYPDNNSQDMKKYRAIGLASENAIAAIGKAIEYKCLNIKEYIIIWIDNLPLSLDETEMEEQHDILSNFIINNKYQEFNLEKNTLIKCFKALINLYKDKIRSNSYINSKIETIFKNNEFKEIIETIYIEYSKEKNMNTNKIEKLIN